MFPPPRERDVLLFGLGAHERSSRGLVLILGVYLGSLVFAALLAPPAYWFVQWLAGVGVGAPVPYLAGKGFEDYFDRLRWVPVVLGLPLLLRACGLLSPLALGLDMGRGGRREFLRWWLAGLGVAGTVVVMQAAFREVTARPAAAGGGWLGVGVMALLGGLLLGLLEEIVFRGLVLRSLLSAVRTVLVAVLLAALFFAYVHFKMPDEVWQQAGGEVRWWSGFYVALWTLLGISRNFEALLFTNYVLLGLLLSLLYLRTRSLMSCAGLHAGLVFVMLTYSKLFAPMVTAPWFFGGATLRDGLLTTILLAALCAVVAVLPGRPAGRSSTAPKSFSASPFKQ